MIGRTWLSGLFGRHKSQPPPQGFNQQSSASPNLGQSGKRQTHVPEVFLDPISVTLEVRLHHKHLLFIC